MTLKLVHSGAGAPRTASGWAARLDRGELDQAENDAFESWLDEPGNPEAYARAASVLHVFDDLDGFSEIEALRAEALGEDRDYAPAAEPLSVRRWTPWAGGAVAASLLAALLIVGWPSGPERPAGGDVEVAQSEVRPSATSSPSASIYKTKVGEQRTLVLADGSRVTLNTASEIFVDYRQGERIVRLARGQALFDVAHARDRPFSVVVAGRKVTALGTVFEVRLDKDRLKVTLVRGKVRVDEEADAKAGATPKPLAILAPGQQFVSVGALAPIVEGVDVEKELLWRRSLIEFENETVASAVAELNRYTSTQIVVSDSDVAAMRMSGIVKTGDAAEFTELVGAMLPVVSRKNERGEIELHHSR